MMSLCVSEGPELLWAVGGGGGASWGGCQTGVAEDQGRTSNCAAGRRHDTTSRQNLSSTRAPEGIITTCLNEVENNHFYNDSKSSTMKLNDFQINLSKRKIN